MNDDNVNDNQVQGHYSQRIRDLEHGLAAERQAHKTINQTTHKQSLSYNNINNTNN